VSGFAGVDVGGTRKGFHAAIVDGSRLVAGPAHLPDIAQTVSWLAKHDPTLVAVDSPIELGPRECERALARAVCHLYYTPARPEGDFYAWMRHGLDLYRALRDAGLAVIECFPTATWTRLAAPRGARSRRAWSSEIVARLPLAGVPARLGQDGRDAIGAAYTAWLHTIELSESFGPIVVPARARSS
jgi:predicted nuclease with RNAse H fold